MISGTVPKRYARALMAHAQEFNVNVESLWDELRSFAEQLKPGSELSNLMNNKLIPSFRKSELLEKIIAKSSFSSLAANFLILLQKRERLVLLPYISHEFRRLADDLEGIVRGEVLVAEDMPENVLKSLRDKLTSVMSKKVILKVTKNPKIIGGLIVKVGSLSFDGSIRAQLDSIKEKFTEGVKF